MDGYDTGIWTLRYNQYDDDDLREVIERGGAHGELAQAILNQRMAGQATSTPCAASDRQTRPQARDTRSPHSSTDAE